MNYKVNTYAKGLKTQKSKLVALIIPNTTNPFFAVFADYIESALYKRKLKLLLCCADGIPEKEIDYLNMSISNKVDGIIALTYSDVGKYIPQDTPIVVFDRFFVNHAIPRVSSDNFAVPDKRRAGFENACLSLGLKYEMKLINDGEPFEEFDSFLAEHIHEGKLSFDGIFCVTDSLAYYVIKTLRRLHQRVPEDVQVIGFDGIRSVGNIDYICSTIVQPVQEIAEMCVELLLQDNTSLKPPLVCFPVTYVYGGSTAEALTVRQ